MGEVTCDVTMSLDGYVAGPEQSLENPLGVGGERMHRWMFEQRETNAAAVEKITAAGAYIMGRRMFGPDRGEWDLDWTGWWGEEPPYHAPVFVLSHHPREPVPMKGGTTFHFVTDGIAAALVRAREAAGERNVAIAGGAQTIDQYLAAGLIDELRLHVAPVILGGGARLFDGVGDLALRASGTAPGTDLVTHLTYRITR
ncbi:dihydrofolate reductase family protein [Spirillospora sp. NPDC052242]